jgi:multiple sugar transport system permease protein
MGVGLRVLADQLPERFSFGGRARLRLRRWLGRTSTYLMMTLLGAVFTFPFFYTASSSLKTVSEMYTFPPVWFPQVPQPSNYQWVVEKMPFGLWYLNSALVTVLGLTGCVVTSTLVAYSFARFRWPGRDLLFIITLGTLMIPGEVTLIPQYLIFKELGWLDSIKPLWVPSWFGGNAFAIFLLRQFLMSLPKDLDEAAVVDGASYPQILISILVPLMKPALATLAVIKFISDWNEFMGPLIYLNTRENFTIALGLRYFAVAPSGTGMIPQDHYLMAACVMTIVPCIALFFAAQRYFVQGIVMTGIKG